MKMFHVSLFTALLSLLFSTTALAHQVRMSVYVEGSVLEGEIYFVGGGNPPGKGATVELLQGEQTLQTAIADEEGYFTFAPVPADSYQVRADMGQGHVAFYDVDISEFPDAQPITETVPASSRRVTDSTLAECAPVDNKVLQGAISKAIRPLREQIDRYEAKVRMHDIIGGIGYIFGLFGVLVLLRRRKV